jgi:inner membrane transporter RhtA
MPIAAVVSTPIAIFDAVPAFSSPTLLAAGVGVGVCSSVIPYVFDQLAMARLTRETYALLVSILPATATVIGVIVLAQIPTLRELSGVAMVIAAVGIHRDRVAAADPGPDE